MRTKFLGIKGSNKCRKGGTWNESCGIELELEVQYKLRVINM